jgi:hypothetical protein
MCIQSRADVFWTALAEKPSPDNAQQSSTSAGRFPNSPQAINGAQLTSAADPRLGNTSLNFASNLPRSSQANNGAQLDRADGPRADNANGNGNNATEQVANLSISPKTVRIPLEVRKSGQYTHDIVSLKP